MLRNYGAWVVQNAMAVPLVLAISLFSGEAVFISRFDWVRPLCSLSLAVQFSENGVYNKFCLPQLFACGALVFGRCLFHLKAPTYKISMTGMASGCACTSQFFCTMSWVLISREYVLVRLHTP